MDTVFISALHIETIIGVHAFEQNAPRPLILDLEMGVDIREAAASDRIRDAVDYSAVADAIARLAAARRFQLLETLAETIARMVFERFPIATLDLSHRQARRDRRRAHRRRADQPHARGLRRLRHALKALRVSSTSAPRTSAAMKKLQRLELLKDFIQEAVDRGATSVQAVHQYIADLPFEALEQTGLISEEKAGLRQKTPADHRRRLRRDPAHQPRDRPADLRPVRESRGIEDRGSASGPGTGAGREARGAEGRRAEEGGGEAQAGRKEGRLTGSPGSVPGAVVADRQQQAPRGPAVAAALELVGDRATAAGIDQAVRRVADHHPVRPLSEPLHLCLAGRLASASSVLRSAGGLARRLKLLPAIDAQSRAPREAQPVAVTTASAGRQQGRERSVHGFGGGGGGGRWKFRRRRRWSSRRSAPSRCGCRPAHRHPSRWRRCRGTSRSGCRRW